MVIDAMRVGRMVSEGVYRIPRFVDRAVYLVGGRPAGSVGRSVHDGRIEVALDARYQNHPDWECLASG